MTQKFNYTAFYIRDRQIVDGSNCFFGLMTALSSQKLKDTKYSMWLQKEVNNSIQQDFLNRVPLYCGWFHWFCYFWVMTILSNQKLKNAKYRFWLQRGVKNIKSNHRQCEGRDSENLVGLNSWPLFVTKNHISRFSAFGSIK